MPVEGKITGLSRFFKLILSPRLDDLQKLEIPRKFVKTYGKNLPHIVHLNIPSGAKWKVSLLKDNDRVWLQDGWAEFVKFYSISHGHFLVFTYEGDSHFSVVIFDMSATEIEYPLGASQCRASLKRKRADLNCVKEAEAMRRTPKVIAKVFYGIQSGLTPDEIEMVEALHFKFPTFAVKIKPFHLKSTANVNLPKKFVIKYLKNERGMFTFRNQNGRFWVVRCADTNKGPATGVAFTAGWRRFAIDNKLQTDDICAFELIRSNEKLFNVQIIPVVKENAKSNRKHKLTIDTADNLDALNPPSPSMKVANVMPETVMMLRNSLSAGEIKRLEEYHRTNPSFVIKLRPSHLKPVFRVSVPAGFVRKYLKNKRGNFTIQNVLGKSWPVILFDTQTGADTVVNFLWKQFALDNNLNRGDICIFELVKGARRLFKVGVLGARRENPEGILELKKEVD